MSLPSNHPWKNGAPTKSNKYLFGLFIGASNLPVGAQTSTLPVHYNTNRNFLYKHNDAIVGFSDPPNNQSVTTYSNLDETGTQNIVSFFSEKVREYTDRKIICLTAGESTKGLSNQTNGFASPLMLGQTENLIDAAVATIGKAPDFAVLAVSDGDMKFNPTEATIISLITSYIASLRAIVGNSNLPIFIRCPSTPPTTTAISDLYPTWSLHNTTLKALDISNVYPVDTDSLTVATYRESDEIHGNALGNKTFAGLLTDEMVTAGVLPLYS